MDFFLSQKHNHPNNIYGWNRLLRALFRIRAYRRNWRQRIPFIFLYKKWRKNLEKQSKDKWRGSYILQNDRDFFYVPSKVDVLSGLHLIEPLESIPVINNFCPPGGVAIDIGANLGEWSLQMARSVGPTGKLYAFEPVPTLNKSLNKTLLVNGQFHAHTISKAVSNADGETIFTFNKEHTGVSKIGDFDTSDETEKLVIETVKLDSFINEKGIKRIDFIKVDVEGHEAEVIEGASECLSLYKPAIVLEAGLDPDQNRDKIHEILVARDYNLMGIIMAHGIIEVEWSDYTSRKGLLSETGLFNSGFVNLLFVPQKDASN